MQRSLGTFCVALPCTEAGGGSAGWCLRILGQIIHPLSLVTKKMRNMHIVTPQESHTSSKDAVKDAPDSA